jgi:cyclase
MFRPRVIPVLLLKDRGIIKSIRFKQHRYIGDPINAVKLFNDFKADELVFLDITASKENRLIPLDFIKKVGEEANMPFSVGGGIKSLNDIRTILAAGAERVIVNTEACRNPEFVYNASKSFGTSTIVVCIDIKRNFFGEIKTWYKNGTMSLKYSPLEFAQLMEDKGAGELIVQSIEKDGTMTGYDIDLIRKISEKVTVPVVALGGAGSFADLKRCYVEGNASALAAGSIFVYQGPRKGILINYPGQNDLNKLTT